MMALRWTDDPEVEKSSAPVARLLHQTKCVVVATMPIRLEIVGDAGNVGVPYP
jgi:hypothetical protein